MTWTKAHSKNAVAAKARRRIARATAEWPDEPRARVVVPRRPRATMTIHVRDHLAGDSLTLNLRRSPFPNLWVCELGQFSSAKLGRVITLLLQSAGGR
jgi:hypothetical protein